jgi:hypothetical protein
MDVQVMRRVLGTASSQDPSGDYILFYDFKPAEGVKLPACSVLYWWEDIDAFLIGKDGEDTDPMELEEFEAVKLLSEIPRI